MFWTAADGSGQPESLVVGPSTQFPVGWTPDGAMFAFSQTGATTGADIMYLTRADGAIHSFAETPAGETSATLSPDGRWLAYVSNESGRREVYVRPFPAGEGRWQVSSDGGIEPRWSRFGREIVYRSGDRFFSVAVETRPTFSAGRPDTLFQGAFQANIARATYDVSADGEEFIIVGGEGGSQTIVVTLNPLAELTRKRR